MCRFIDWHFAPLAKEIILINEFANCTYNRLIKHELNSQIKTKNKHMEYIANGTATYRKQFIAERRECFIEMKLKLL